MWLLGNTVTWSHSQIEPGEEGVCGYTVTQSHGHTVSYLDVAGQGRGMWLHGNTVTQSHNLIFICSWARKGYVDTR
jgi:hypothetical protein